MSKQNRKERPSVITLIGMPSAGKTKVGKRLAEILEIDFVDTDERIVTTIGAKSENLHAIVKRLSSDDFAISEEKVVIQTLTALRRPTVLATGGSVVYSDTAMRMLHSRSIVVYLRATLETIERRLAKSPERGLVLAPEETIKDLYKRRIPLYERWAQYTVDSNDNRSVVAEKLAKKIQKNCFK